MNNLEFGPVEPHEAPRQDVHLAGFVIGSYIEAKVGQQPGLPDVENVSIQSSKQEDEELPTDIEPPVDVEVNKSIKPEDIFFDAVTNAAMECEDDLGVVLTLNSTLAPLDLSGISLKSTAGREAISGRIQKVENDVSIYINGPDLDETDVIAESGQGVDTYIAGASLLTDISPLYDDFSRTNLLRFSKSVLGTLSAASTMQETSDAVNRIFRYRAVVHGFEKVAAAEYALELATPTRQRFDENSLDRIIAGLPHYDVNSADLEQIDSSGAQRTHHFGTHYDRKHDRVGDLKRLYKDPNGAVIYE